MRLVKVHISQRPWLWAACVHDQAAVRDLIGDEKPVIVPRGGAKPPATTGIPKRPQRPWLPKSRSSTDEAIPRRAHRIRASFDRIFAVLQVPDGPSRRARPTCCLETTHSRRRYAQAALASHIE